jgi:hypothetical protein
MRGRGATVHNRLVSRSAGQSQRLQVSPDVAAVLRPEEALRLHELRDAQRVRCAVCSEWIEPGARSPTSVSLTLGAASVRIDFSHAECAPSRADLAALAVRAQAEPLGIHYVHALHPDAGAVLLWERKLDLRIGGLDARAPSLYLDAEWWEGFHPALAEEPVRLLVGWLLRADGDDLALCRQEAEVERFHDAVTRAPEPWMAALRESGFCLMIVGAGIGLERPQARTIQRAIRDRRALMGLAEYEL